VFFPGASSTSISTYTKDKARPPFPVGPSWVPKKPQFCDVLARRVMRVVKAVLQKMVGS